MRPVLQVLLGCLQHPHRTLVVTLQPAAKPSTPRPIEEHIQIPLKEPLKETFKEQHPKP